MNLGVFCSVFNVLSPSQLINISDNYMTLMSDNGDIREDLRVPDSDVGREIESKFEAGDDFLVSVIKLQILLLRWGNGRAGSEA